MNSMDVSGSADVSGITAKEQAAANIFLWLCGYCRQHKLRLDKVAEAVFAARYKRLDKNDQPG